MGTKQSELTENGVSLAAVVTLLDFDLHWFCSLIVC